MFRKEQETGKRVTVVDQHGKEFDLIEFNELLDEEGFEVEEAPLLRTPGGRKVSPVPGEEGKFIVEGSGEVLTRVRETVPE